MLRGAEQETPKRGGLLCSERARAEEHLEARRLDEIHHVAARRGVLRHEGAREEIRGEPRRMPGLAREGVEEGLVLACFDRRKFHRVAQLIALRQPDAVTGLKGLEERE